MQKQIEHPENQTAADAEKSKKEMWNMSELENKKIGFIGGGRMVEAIFSGMLASGLIKKENVYVADISDSRLDFLVETYGIQAVRKTENCENQGNLDVVDLADVVVIGTIPQVADKILTDVAPKMDEKMPVVLSIMGGITLDFLQRYIRKAPVIRIMPNTPMLVQEGAAGVALGKNASEKDGRIALEIFNSVGNAYLLPESLIDPLTSVSGCGPAYAAMFIQSLADGGVEMGLPREMAVELAAKTLIGTGKMVLEKGLHPEILKDNVCTPGGGTIAGVRALEAGGFRGIVMDAVEGGMKRMIEVAEKA